MNTFMLFFDACFIDLLIMPCCNLKSLCTSELVTLLHGTESRTYWTSSAMKNHVLIVAPLIFLTLSTIKTAMTIVS